MAELAKIIANASISDNKTKKQLEKLGIESDDDMTNNTLVTASIFKSAVQGNMAAVEKWEKLTEDEKSKRSKIYHFDLDMVPDTFHSVIRDMRSGPEEREYLEYVFKGGRGSIKSSTAAEIIPELMKNNPEVHCLICRQIGNTMKDSVYAKLKWAIEKQGLSEEFDFKKSPLEITLKETGQKIYFRGADDPDKIKSIAPEFGYIGILWFEELDQFEGPEAVRKIEQSAIRGGDVAWILKTFNPPKSKDNWVNQYCIEYKPNRIVHHSTYKDVPKKWLGGPFIEEAEHLKEINPSAYDHEYMGNANGIGGQVFDNLELRPITEEEIKTFDRRYAGVDWGWFPDKYVFIVSYYNPKTETIYLLDENVCNKQSNENTAKWILDRYGQQLGFFQYGIICDSSENKSVADYVDLGVWNAKPAYKPPGSVDYGMKWLQRRKIVIDPTKTPYAYEEFKRYEYQRDKDGNIISGYPDKDNHAIDALRYSYSPLFLRRNSNA